MITDLEPDILECEVKWALESITMNKASGGDGIPAELFQILKDDTAKSAALNMPANLENSAMATGLDAKECSNYHTIALISHTSKVMLKILQARFQQYMTVKFQMFKLVLEKAEEQEIKLPASAGSSKKQESSRKASTSALLTIPKPLTVWITINCGKF